MDRFAICKKPSYVVFDINHKYKYETMNVDFYKVYYSTNAYKYFSREGFDNSFIDIIEQREVKIDKILSY